MPLRMLRHLILFDSLCWIHSVRIWHGIGALGVRFCEIASSTPWIWSMKDIHTSPYVLQTPH